MNFDVVTIGDAFEDVFVAPKLSIKSDRTFASGRGISFEFGEKIPLDWVEYEIGGSACNIAVGLSRQGYRCGLATVLGEDTPKQRVLERLRREKVSSECILIDKKNRTGFSVVFSIEGERTIFVYHGIKDYHDLKINQNIEAKWFFVTSLGEETEEIEKRIVEEVSEKGAKFAWNPGARQIAQGTNRFKHLLKCTDILFLNREEALKFVNFPVRPQIEEVMRRLNQLGAKIVVVTNGKEGARAFDGKQFYEEPADLKIKRIDSTGAGDAFASGFLGRLLNEGNIGEKEIGEALKWGVLNSNSVIQYVGAQRGLLSVKTIQRTLE